MKKRFVLDTNVLLHDPGAINHFADEEVVVPIYVIAEIDQFKRELSERGRHARMISRYLDELRTDGGHLADGVPNKSGGRLRVAFVPPDAPPPNLLGSTGKLDEMILTVALQEQKREPLGPVIFVTKDINLRIRADALGLQAVDYMGSRVDIEELYTGSFECDVTSDLVDRVYSE